ncbi:oxidoreductase [Pseudomonas capeferrum]|uniref:PDR/VanB family oxidoreductase n=1 Tax=Pseudomonas capeferrum TaxID=1495066 RepID=UPI0015E4773C|nr:PDR/VanB family oxidoreductase [Pseudomonas capeferrum]MBA1203201.1 oxidoreductase [Pseudomonas capeferrum]
MTSLPLDRLELQVKRVWAEAKDVAVLELVAPDGRDLPAFTPGAHLELFLRNGLIRHYSLLNDCIERHRYLIAVGLSANSRGGSRFIHASLRHDDRLQTSVPRNNFMLDPQAQRYCFVAGGIGITPILAMIRWCQREERPWRLIYSVRSLQRAAFYEQLLEIDPARVQWHVTDQQDGRYLDAARVIDSLDTDEQLYCCGPEPLMTAIRDVGEAVAAQLHFEWFSAPSQPTAQAHADAPGGFDIHLRKSGLHLRVGPEQSILEALEENGLEPPYACRSGICRTCETRVCEGEPDHRDLILSDQERAAGDCLLICVSRAHSPSLVLDL